MMTDPQAYRQVMRRFPQGVTVVSLRAGEIEHGMTASSVASLSMDPPLFLVCVDKTARAHDLFPRAGAFVVNLLAQDQAEVSNVFARKELTDDERWAEVTTHESAVGAPRLDGCVGWFDCRLTDALPGGDHTIYVGEVVEAIPGADKPPLVYHDGAYRRLT